jgi:hypothetical protein
MTYIYDTTYLNVRRFHFILLVINMEIGEVEVFDSLSKKSELYVSCFLMLRR